MLQPTFRSLHRLPAVTLAMAMTLAACSTGSSPAPSSAPPAAGTASPAPSAAVSAAAGTAVTIKGFAFNPASQTVAVGSTVTWTNQDSAGHTVTADDGSFGSKTIANGQTFSQTFSTAGTYTYHCAIHKTMTATVVVH